MKPALPSADQIWEFSGGEFVSVTGLPLTDRGFRYGLHSFETLRVRKGRAEFADEHLALLKLSPWAGGFSEWDRVREWLARDLATEGVLRLYLTAGDGGLTAAVGASRLFAWFEARDFSAPPETISVGLAGDPVGPQPGAGKTGNYYPNLAALDQARARGFGEALVFDGLDQLVGAGLANVFYRRGGHWFTPPGFRAGVVRQWVLSQLPVTIAPITRAEIAEIDAAFLTSSGIGVLPIDRIEDRRLEIAAEAVTVRAVFNR